MSVRPTSSSEGLPEVLTDVFDHQSGGVVENTSAANVTAATILLLFFVFVVVSSVASVILGSESGDVSAVLPALIWVPVAIWVQRNLRFSSVNFTAKTLDAALFPGAPLRRRISFSEVSTVHLETIELSRGDRLHKFEFMTRTSDRAFTILRSTRGPQWDPQPVLAALQHAVNNASDDTLLSNTLARVPAPTPPESSRL